MFEYMASGAPVVASDLPVIREVLKNRDNALLVEPDNAEQWADALQLIQKDRNLAGRVASAALKAVESYTWEKRAGSVLAAIS
jgi:glycosyltransferase involved in cell wall biosynthesis